MSASIEASCCIVGGGPAGMMMGFLLARAGVRVIVLEKHADFLRDFRGDTIHPSTLELMYELGLLATFLKLPHQEVLNLGGRVGGTMIQMADFTHLPTHCKFLAIMPQWDFLNFLVEQGRRYPGFEVKMQAEATDLIEQDGRVAGLIAKVPEGRMEIFAPLIVGADGRNSIVRQRAGLKIIDLGAPMDIFWTRISRKPDDPPQTLGHIEAGKMFIMLNRDDYWQCGYVIAKGQAEVVRARGIEDFREDIVVLAPFLQDRASELRDWNDVSLLTVKVDRLEKWSRPGLLCIGDAAHAMSPIGGVGIKLAIQDAVAAANILAEKIRAGNVSDSDLQAVQRRRNFPTRATQKLQVIIQNAVITRVLTNMKQITVPWPLRLILRLAMIRRIPARLIGIGFRPEHIRTPDVFRQ